MFTNTRLKLTSWYLLMIIIISSLFSGFIYYGVSHEMEKGFIRAQKRLEAQEFFQQMPLGRRHFPQEHLRGENIETAPPFFFIDDLNSAKQTLFLYLLSINIVIWVVAAAASYFLAGKSLQPLAKAMEKQKRFISDASHELRTPVTALKTSLEVNIQDKKVNSHAKKILKENLEDVENMENLVNNLLKISRSQAKHNQPLEINKLINKAIKTVQPLLKRKQQTIFFDSTISVKLRADANALTELLLILLDNAIKYTDPKGKIHIVLVKQHKWVQLKITDTGIGIAPKHLPHVFDRLYRVQSSRTSNSPEGYGLGLSLAKKIVEQHKGIISVQSEINKGTTFTIKLPR